MKEEIIRNNKNHKLEIIKSDYNVYTLIVSNKRFSSKGLDSFVDEKKLEQIKKEFEAGRLDWMKDYSWNQSSYIEVTIAVLFLLGMVGYASYRVFIVKG